MPARPTPMHVIRARDAMLTKAIGIAGKRGWTFRQLADSIGINENTLSNARSGSGAFGEVVAGRLGAWIAANPTP